MSDKESEMAKRIQFSQHGGSDVLEYRDYQPAAPGPRKASKKMFKSFKKFYNAFKKLEMYQ